MSQTTTISIIDNLKEELKNDLPGQYFQNLMSPVEDNDKYRIVPKNHKVACVMVLIHPKKDGKLYLSYIIRASSHPDDKHAGQVGFPGGKFEDEDKSLLDCALREVEEELGIDRLDIEVIGELTSLYVFASNFLVYPYVGILKSEPRYIPQVSEVDEVVEIPLISLVDEKIKTQNEIRLAAGILMNAPGYDLNGNFLWGATAMISSELEELIRRSKPKSIKN